MSFVIAKKKLIKYAKAFSNSAEQHFDNYTISYKELDIYINFFKKLTFKQKPGLLEFH